MRDPADGTWKEVALTENEVTPLRGVTEVVDQVGAGPTQKALEQVKVWDTATDEALGFKSVQELNAGIAAGKPWTPQEPSFQSQIVETVGADGGKSRITITKGTGAAARKAGQALPEAIPTPIPRGTEAELSAMRDALNILEGMDRHFRNVGVVRGAYTLPAVFLGADKQQIELVEAARKLKDTAALVLNRGGDSRAVAELERFAKEMPSAFGPETTARVRREQAVSSIRPALQEISQGLVGSGHKLPESFKDTLSVHGIAIDNIPETLSEQLRVGRVNEGSLKPLLRNVSDKELADLGELVQQAQKDNPNYPNYFLRVLWAEREYRQDFAEKAKPKRLSR